MNSCTFIGNLVKDVELKYTQQGTAIATFTLALNKDLSKEKKQEFEAQGKPTADFPRFQAWGKMAETISQYFGKGNKIALQARVQTGSYDKDGTKIYTTDFVVEKFEFVESRGDSANSGNNNNTSNNSVSSDSDFSTVEDDDIPF